MKPLELISLQIAREVPGNTDQIKVLGVSSTFKLIPFTDTLRKPSVGDIFRSDSGSAAVVIQRGDGGRYIVLKLIAPSVDWEYKNFYDIRRYDASGNLIT